MPSGEYNISNASKTTLYEWQKLATEHFLSLATSKKEKQLPVFSLEHPFSTIELELIFESLLKDYRQNGVNRLYWILWVIYATEIGYSYTGEEYWPPFEDKISHWDRQHREEIRWSFKEFQKRFYGTKPKGQWANHFSIIALPITNAVLPKDLQEHFANLLYFCRYKLRTISLNNPESIGKLLAANSYVINSSRFQNFLQQEELVGRLALSLLDENVTDSIFELIYPKTLKRIVSDIEKKKNAIVWIRETRREIKPKILGTAKGFNNKQLHSDTRDTTSKTVLLLKPKLKLFRSQNKEWTIIVEVPQLVNFIDNLEISTLLKKIRFQISGVAANWTPAVSLLHGSIKRRLNKWPEANSLLKFEEQHPILQELFEKQITISKEPWLFSINTDGTATEIEGKFLRPGRKYIALFKDEDSIPKELNVEIVVGCSDVTAREISVPATVSEQLEALYKSWGFEVFKTLKIWPAGLSAKKWDGEGMSEWLTTENATFGISHDFDLEELVVRVGSDQYTLKAKQPGDVTFIKLDPLPAGQHILSIKPKSKSVSQNEGLLCLHVREPIIWTPGIALHNGLTAYLDPNDDNFDTFFNGQTDLKIYAPQDRSITILVDFFLGNALLDSFVSQPISIPFSPDKLKVLRDQIGKRESFGVAQRAKIKINCEDIGQREFILTRNVKPFRWIHQVKNSSTFLRLIDETDSLEKTEVSFFDLLHPDIRVDFSPNDFFESKEVKVYNGLFWAKRLDYQHGIILTDVESKKRNLGFLSITPRLRTDVQFNLVDHLALIQAWYTAQCSTFLAQIHLQKIIEVLVHRIYQTFCGKSWADEELNFISNFNFEEGFRALADHVKNRSLANVVSYRLSQKTNEAINYAEELKWFIDAARRCDLIENPSLLITAVKFSTNPISFLSKPEELKVLVNRIFSNPDTLRSARLFTLGVAKLVEPTKNFILLSPGGLK